MEEVVIQPARAIPPLRDPILIEGLPGVGNVGKLAADYLREQLAAETIATIYSRYFPPQVYVNEDGTIRMVSNELALHRPKGARARDLLILGGDYQGISPEGQYVLTHRILEYCHSLGVREVFTLAGFAQGRPIDEPRVLGAATSLAKVEAMTKLGVVFSRTDPGGGLIGASGLFLGIGRLFGMEGACLMGETSGYFVDPRSAQAVLKILTRALGVEIDLAELQAKAEEIDRIAQRIHEIEPRGTESEAPSPKPAKDDLGYIG
ncbi:MAG: proteasome assembly chaperone family protein [Thermoplasmata archaeon]